MLTSSRKHHCANDLHSEVHNRHFLFPPFVEASLPPSTIYLSSISLICCRLYPDPPPIAILNPDAAIGVPAPPPAWPPNNFVLVVLITDDEQQICVSLPSPARHTIYNFVLFLGIPTLSYTSFKLPNSRLFSLPPPSIIIIPFKYRSFRIFGTLAARISLG